MRDHYAEAERLLELGRSVVTEIRAAAGDEARRDALGKQAMGIWAQAQGHATLATVQRDYRTIPWPPSEELVERVAAAGRERLRSWFGPQVSGRLGDDHYKIIARAVLDVIGGEAS